MLLLIVGSATTAYFAWRRARTVVIKTLQGGDRPRATAGYHTIFVTLFGAAPAACVLLFWALIQTFLLQAGLETHLNIDLKTFSAFEREMLLNFVQTGRTDQLQTILAFGSPFTNLKAQTLLSVHQDWMYTQKFWTYITQFAAIALCCICGTIGLRLISAQLPARKIIERIVQMLLLICSAVAILITAGIVLSLVFEAFRFFTKIPFTDFIFGTKWSPQIALRSDQVGASGSFGAIPVFLGTLVISAIAVGIATPLGILSAVCLSEYASRRHRAILKPIVELLAGVPTVVYGFFAALTVAPLIRNMGEEVGLVVSSESALAAGLVMGVMITPLVSSLSDDVINAVPQSLRQGAWGLGATRSETVRRVVLPAALPGISAAVLLATSRSVGETMIVVMAAGLAANLTLNPLESTTTVTTQITTLLVGDQEFDSAKTLAAFALGLTLFFITFCMNALATHIVAKYREIYD